MTRRDFIDESAVNAYNETIRAANREALRKAAAGEPLTVREQACVDLHAWGVRCVDDAFEKAYARFAK